ncbi:MAG: aminoglycoside 6-adenylyltransferase [Anaerolineales bacterium]|nr:aminoglycoside 6-adenylyltransferase [Anaerolineales bacterium]
MTLTLDSYQNHRDILLAEITASLSNDKRFVAGWLTGSFGRNNADAVSDIDINLVVSDTDSSNLCMQFAQVSAQTSPERYSVFSQFGTPALIHENNNNAPEGGTFTFVLYEESAIMIDWTLIPQSKALRPYQSKILFDKVGIPVSSPPEPEDLEQSRKSVAELWAFFWMMTAVTVKYIIRGDSIFVTQWLENLYGLIQDIGRRINREPWNYTRGSLSEFQTTREKQIESIHKLCERMQELKPKVSEFIMSEPAIPISEIETLLELTNK